MYTRALSLMLMLVYANGVDRKIKDKSYWSKQRVADFDKVLKNQPITNVARNVILILGDGYGISTQTASRIYKGELNGRQMDDESNLQTDSFNNVALIRTMCADRMVGSSDCCASALFNGVKVRDAVLNVDDTIALADCAAHTANPDKSSERILQVFNQTGRSVGIVTTARITHATPAAAYSSIVSRHWERDSQLPKECQNLGYKDIARQLVEEHHYIKVLFGGGRRELMPESEEDPEKGTGKRKDGRNLINEWKETHKANGNTYQYVTDLAGFNNIDLDTDRVMGLFENSAMKYEADRRKSNDDPSLSQMAKKAIQLLEKNPKGYFLLIESALIDFGHHAGQARYALSEGVHMDETVKTVLDVINTDDTLLLVTGDHPHVFNIGGYPKVELPILGLSHQMSDVDNKPYTILNYGNGPGYNHPAGGRQDLTNVDTTAWTYKQQAAVPNKDETHSGSDVALYGHGTMAHLVGGVHHQPYVHELMRYAACLPPYESTTRCQANDVTRPIVTSSLLLICTIITSTWRYE